MKRLVPICVLLLGACATPTTDKVSLDGPAKTTTTEATTTTAPTTTAVQAPVEVARWSGDADTDTENFTVNQSWELHWKMTGQYHAGGLATWYTPQDKIQSGFLQLPDGEGSSLIREGGTFYLHIAAILSHYDVWVVDVPN